jgi:hypothetical protein
VVVKQLFSTITYNLNAYLCPYLIQTPSICGPTKALTSKTRRGWLGEGFAQERNQVFSQAYKNFSPMDEGAILLFVDRDSFTNWDTIMALCPSLNALQVLSLVEMLAIDSTQPKPLPQKVRDEIDKKVFDEDNQTLFFRPIKIHALEK